MDDERDPGVPPAPPSADPAPGVDRGDRVHAFRDDAIEVTWSRRRCIHVAACVFTQPAVFQPGRRPWVDVTRAGADDVAATVLRCPTGALHYSRRDGAAPEPVPAENVIVVSRNGPLYLAGDVEVCDERGEVRLTDTRVALCRCGRTGNAPLCDGSHHAAAFRDGGTLRDTSPAEPGEAAASSRLRIEPVAGGPLRVTGPFTLFGAAADDGVTGGRVKLCRCGRSDNKPFCDGSHKRAPADDTPRG